MISAGRFTLRHATVTARGFSIIEFLIVFAILTIVLAITFDGMEEYAAQQSFTNTIAGVKDGAVEARQKTLASVNGEVYGVHVASDEVVFFEGSTYVAGAASNEVVSLPDYFSVSTSLTGGAQTLTFARLTGVPTATGTIAFSDLRIGKTATITISTTGLVE